jgi:hypothetical protein
MTATAPQLDWNDLGPDSEVCTVVDPVTLCQAIVNYGLGGHVCLQPAVYDLDMRHGPTPLCERCAAFVKGSPRIGVRRIGIMSSDGVHLYAGR